MRRQITKDCLHFCERVTKVCCETVAEGMVLLENDGMLPLKSTDKVAVFGRAQFEYLKSGSGSGGQVVCPYVTQIGEELKKAVITDERTEKFYREWIKKHPYDNGDNWKIPQFQTEAPVDEKFVKSISVDNEKAVIVIARLCGEAFDLAADKGGYSLTDEEDNTILYATKYFKHVCVLLNTGNLLDMSWVKKYAVGTVAYVWQGGQEGGLGVVRALTGELIPSGRLADTIAMELKDYPAHGNFGDIVKNIHVEDIFVGYRYFDTFAKKKVLYPFGYGLSYTKFVYSEIQSEKNENAVTLKITVKNVGQYSGKDVVQCYVSKPQGIVCKPMKELVAFQKTKLLKSGESQKITIEIQLNDLASYNDKPDGVFAFSYILEKGDYRLYVGANVRDAQEVFSFRRDETVCVCKCSQALAPNENFKRMTFDGQNLVYENVPQNRSDLNERVKRGLPSEIPYSGDKGHTLQDVANGKITLSDYVAQFGKEELCLLVRGEGMSSPKAPVDGTAGSFAGVSSAWANRGTPVVTTVDGPCGIRLTQKDGVATCIPTGTLIASTWSPEIVKNIFGIFVTELKDYRLDIALAPGINIHRYPLGGRNFEYFSEDPYLTGVMASAIVKCFDDNGVSCTLKHFAVNSQENGRRGENEVVSERALREIYLKGFEIAVKNGGVKYIMTAFNRINGTSSASNFDLLTTILRNEWGFDGVVMTDWWPLIDSHYNKTSSKYNLSSLIRAQNDLFMVTPEGDGYPDDLTYALDNGYLTVGELQCCAMHILGNVMETPSFQTFDKSNIFNSEYEKEPAQIAENANSFLFALRESGKFHVKIFYSCADDETIQNEIAICLDGKESRKILLKGTNGAVESHAFMLYIYEGNSVSFEGSAKISRIEIYRFR